MLSLLSVVVLSATPPEVALLCTAPMGDFSELRFQRVGSRELAPVAARFIHAEGSTVLGALLPGTRVVLAIATVERARDESFAASLFRLEAGKAPRRLVSGLAVSTRPLVTPEGRVFVQRGRAGAPPAEPGALRLDELTLDEVDPSTGETRTVLAATASLAFLAGHFGRELIVYRVDASGARLEAVHMDTLGVRPLLPRVSDLSRDFVVDAPGKRLLFTTGDPATGRWHLEALDLGTLALVRLAEGPSMALLPTPFPDGRVGFAPGPGQGLRSASSGAALTPPQGPGYERLRFFTREFAIGLHEVPGDFPRALALSIKDNTPATLATPPQLRLDVAGVLP